jgi:hypothetical protein
MNKKKANSRYNANDTTLFYPGEFCFLDWKHFCPMQNVTDTWTWVGNYIVPNGMRYIFQSSDMAKPTFLSGEFKDVNGDIIMEGVLKIQIFDPSLTNTWGVPFNLPLTRMNNAKCQEFGVMRRDGRSNLLYAENGEAIVIILKSPKDIDVSKSAFKVNNLLRLMKK